MTKKTLLNAIGITICCLIVRRMQEKAKCERLIQDFKVQLLTHSNQWWEEP